MSIGVWQLVLVLLLFLIPVGIAFAAVRLNTRDNRKSRKEFTLRVLAVIVAAMVVELALPEGPDTALIGLVIALASVAFIAYWAVDRLSDIGSVSKNKAVITGVPVVGLFYLIYLMVAKGAGFQAASKSPQSDASSPARSRKARIRIIGIAFVVVGLLAAVTVPNLLRGDYFELCMIFYPGEGVSGYRRARDYKERCLKWAAERGEVSAQSQLGDWYADGVMVYADGGFHVSQDHSKAVRWWRRAAQARDVPIVDTWWQTYAQVKLADSYFEGRGVEQDHQAAAYWYKRAAEQGVPIAWLRLAFMYEHGLGIEQDDFIALRWYRRAAEYGFLSAMLNLGERYAEGRTVPQDYVQAHKWFNLAGSGAAASEEALRDRAIRARERVAAAMTPEQIAEAQRLAREWEITW